MKKTESYGLDSRVVLLHEGGTKMYELVLLVVKETGTRILIRRYGKRNSNGDFHSSAQIKMDSGTDGQMRFLYNKLLKDKSGSGYNPTTLYVGFHKLRSRFVDENWFSGEAFVNLLLEHYGHKNASLFTDWYFGNNHSIPVDAGLPSKKAPEEPVERGENWGSW